jgi:hypothetical protein
MIVDEQASAGKKGRQKAKADGLRLFLPTRWPALRGAAE